MSNKPQTEFHDSSASNCMNHLNYLHFTGKAARPDRTCALCAPAEKPKVTRTRRRATKAAS